ncbi:hypothetical protein PENSTE_c007G09367 [Penicillium steckii]|uniref:Microbial-type PARG catalytic domain-containing protein n=1 Tax=Penicillium steckii TaxID=303698 RepID=A0A1V6TG81_9EURO|nr:hypothetical protein PENSTE_c007G09367 [Penicillium steckii]
MGKTGNDPILQDEEKRPSKKSLRDVTKDTLEIIPYIMKSLEEAGEAPRYSVLYNDRRDSCWPLDKKSPYFPRVHTDVRVVLEDSLDAAVSLGNVHQLLGSHDTTPVCILNFANQTHIGGGFYSGSLAQEEDICRRSTLIDTLHPHYYPMKDDECIYSPSVFVFRENARKADHKIMWIDDVSLLPEVSVISMAAECRPALNSRRDDYAKSSSRHTMLQKMRFTLRVAGNNYHRRLILGAIGCGVFGHPPKVVAQLWAEVLSENEFEGWFETIVFAVWDPKPPHKNFLAFSEVLSGHKLWEYQNSEDSSDSSSMDSSEDESEDLAQDYEEDEDAMKAKDAMDTEMPDVEDSAVEGSEESEGPESSGESEVSEVSEEA